MSKLENSFCDICGQLLYHSLHSYTRPSQKWGYSWWWHGRKEQASEVDICDDCADAVSTLVNRNRKKIERVKQEAVEKDKSPNRMMEEALNIKRRFKL